MLCFAVADRLKMDVRDVGGWPVDLLYEWVAFYELTKPESIED